MSETICAGCGAKLNLTSAIPVPCNHCGSYGVLWASEFKIEPETATEAAMLDQWPRYIPLKPSTWAMAQEGAKSAQAHLEHMTKQLAAKQKYPPVCIREQKDNGERVYVVGGVCPWVDTCIDRFESLETGQFFECEFPKDWLSDDPV